MRSPKPSVRLVHFDNPKVDTLIIKLHDYLRPDCRATFERGAQRFDAAWTQGKTIIRTKGNRLPKGK